MRNKLTQKGFTLLEILIALFIFTILSLLCTQALRSVIDAQNGSAVNAERLRNLQQVLLMLSRDIEQTVDRPVWTNVSTEEGALVGNAANIRLTHAGIATTENIVGQSGLQRVHYYSDKDGLWRETWRVLDQTPQTTGYRRLMLRGVSALTFSYLANDKHFYATWPPPEGQNGQTLPLAIKVSMQLKHWGVLTQLYVIPTQKEAVPPPMPAEKS